MYGDQGNDKLVGGDGGEYGQKILGGDGDDIVYGGNDMLDTDNAQVLYGDYNEEVRVEGVDNAFGDYYYEWMPEAELGGNDKIIGGNNLLYGQLIAGGPYDDKIWTGSNIAANGNLGDGTFDILVYGDKDDQGEYGPFVGIDGELDGMPLIEFPEGWNKFDGNDLIDVGDNNFNVGVYGQGGNDKIIGGYGPSQVDKLWGGTGDDKIWLIEPERRDEDINAMSNYGYGNDGNDKLYGTDGADTLWGDDYGANDASLVESFELEGGDDWVAGYGGDDIIELGYGNDQADGGDGNDYIYGRWGDDKIFGGDGNDLIFGDDKATAYIADPNMTVVPTGAGQFMGIESGKDKIYGGLGDDIVYGGHLDDEIHGGEGADILYGEGGEDIIWGDEGMDIIKAGYGWDTIFGGPGCDTIYTYDGGDVVWLGDCEDEVVQKVFIYGTGIDPENWTVIMDFWLPGAKPWNQICPRESKHQGKPSAAMCGGAFDNSDLCFTANDLFSPGTLMNNVQMMGG